MAHVLPTRTPARHNLSLTRPPGAPVLPALPSSSAASSAQPSARGVLGGEAEAAAGAGAIAAAGTIATPAFSSADSPMQHKHSLQPGSVSDAPAAAAAQLLSPTRPSYAQPGSALTTPTAGAAAAPSLALPRNASNASLQSHSRKPGGGGGGSREREREAKEQTIPVSGSGAGPGGARISAHKLLELEEEILDLKQGAQRKDEYIAGLQRNCETLSALCAKHMQQVMLLKGDFDRVLGEKHLLEANDARFHSNEALATRLVKENEELLKARSTLTQRVEALQSKVYSTQQQLSELSEAKADLSSDLIRERNQHASMRMEVEELRMIMNADSGNSSNLGKRSSTGGKSEIEHKILSLKSEYESNKSALEQLQQAHKLLLTQHQKSTNIATRVEQERDFLEQDNARLKKGLAVLRKEHAESREVAQVAQEQNDILRQAHSDLSAAAAHAQKRLPEVERDLAKSERSRAALKKQYDALWSEKEDLLLQLDEMRVDLNLKSKQAEILRSEGQEIHSARGGNAAKDAELVGLLAERTTLAAKITELQEKIRSLETQLAESDHSLQRWQSKYEAANTAKASLSSELDQAQQEAKRLTDALKAAKDGDHVGRGELQAALDAARAQLASAGTGAQADLERARREAAEAKAAAAAADSAARAAQAQLDAQASSHAAALAEMKSRADAALGSQLAESERAAALATQKLMAAQHRLAELEAVLDQPRLSGPDLAKLAQREKELHAAVAKLVVNEEASEASFTCFACMDIFTKPVTCIPCGHSYCLACIEKTHVCSQCRPPVKVTYYSNELLEELCSRFIFRKQTLATLRDMTAHTSSSGLGAVPSK